MFLTLDAVAARLSVSRSTVRRLLASGTLPYIRVLRAIRVPEAALEGIAWQYAPTGTPKAVRAGEVLPLGKGSIGDYDCGLYRAASLRIVGPNAVRFGQGYAYGAGDENGQATKRAYYWAAAALLVGLAAGYVLRSVAA